MGSENAIQIDAIHTHTHTFTTALWYTDEYRDCSNVTKQHDGRRKKKKNNNNTKLFHVTILIQTMQRSKAEAEKPRYIAACSTASN